jgi:branched-chain amino acid transport system substrate-binding protein
LATKISRRKFLAASGATAAIAKVARPAVAQQNPVKIGLITVKTGGLAAGGVHLEEGIACFLKDKNFTLAGRKIELVVADTAGVPATAKAKAIELVERDKVDLIMGPLAAFEWLAIKDYLGEHKMPPMFRSDSMRPHSTSMGRSSKQPCRQPAATSILIN